MDAAKVRALFPDAEIDAEGFFTPDRRIQLLRDAEFGFHLNVISLSQEQWEALLYWYQNPQVFQGAQHG